MQNEILLVAQSVSGEKGISQDSVFEAIELALATATKKRYQEPTNIEVNINRDSGEYETFRVWEVVEEEEFEHSGLHKTLEEVKEDKELSLGSLIKEKVDNTVQNSFVTLPKYYHVNTKRGIFIFRAYLCKTVKG